MPKEPREPKEKESDLSNLSNLDELFEVPSRKTKKRYVAVVGMSNKDGSVQIEPGDLVPDGFSGSFDWLLAQGAIKEAD
jgi:hypothetical protein